MYVRLSFIIILFTCTKSSINATDMVALFNQAFKGYSPFFGISIARDTITPAYGGIDVDEEKMIFCILESILSGVELRPEIIDYINVIAENKENQYIEIKRRLISKEEAINEDELRNDLIDSAVESFSKVPKFIEFFNYTKDTKIKFKQKLKDFIQSRINEPCENIDALRAHLKTTFDVIDKPSTIVFEQKSAEIKKIIEQLINLQKVKKEKARAQLEKELSKDQANFFGYYEDSIGTQDPHYYFRRIINAQLQYIRNLAQFFNKKIKSHPCLIVFNEMFFSKDHPLTIESLEEKQNYIKNLTHKFSNILVHANFLFQDTLNFENEEKYKSFVNKQYRTFTMLHKFTEKEIFETSEKFTYEDYRVQFLETRDTLNIIKNQSFIYWNNTPLMSYLKSSYRNEADKYIKEGAFYILGQGQDLIIYDEHISNADSCAMAKIVNKYLSTEICYDSNIGVRKSLKTYPANGKIHIIVSNTLSIDNQENVNNFSTKIPLLFHVDPKYQEIFINNENNVIFNPELVAESNDPFHKNKINQLVRATPIITFRLNLGLNDVFIFHLWDLNYLLKISQDCQKPKHS